MIRPVLVKSVKDIEHINRVDSKYPFDIWIHGESAMADAKSLLGIYVLELKEPLFLVIPDEANLCDVV